MQPRASGRLLGGKYHLRRPLDGGGMGSVWVADHLTLNSPVAVKLMNPVVAADPQAIQRFLLEARTAALLRSPHVVQILDYGVDGETPYIVMEMLEGESLAARLDRSGRSSFSATARVIRHVARAIGRAHDAGIIHRDLKPENIFIVSNDDDELIKVLDFGIVKTNLTDLDLSSTRTGVLLGTPYYMSPEQAQGSKSVSFKTDIWALGVIAFQCLLGELPFRGDSIGRLILEICSHPLPVPSEVGPVPPGFDAWFARACARDVTQRFDSAKRAADEFDLLDDDDGASTSPPSLEASRPPLFTAPAETSPDSGPPDTTTAQFSGAELRSHTAERARTPRWAPTALLATLLIATPPIVWVVMGRRQDATPAVPSRDAQRASNTPPVAIFSPESSSNSKAALGVLPSGASAAATAGDAGAAREAAQPSFQSAAEASSATIASAPPASAATAKPTRHRPSRPRSDARRQRKGPREKLDVPEARSESEAPPSVDLGI